MGMRLFVAQAKLTLRENTFDRVMSVLRTAR